MHYDLQSTECVNMLLGRRIWLVRITCFVIIVIIIIIIMCTLIVRSQTNNKHPNNCAEQRVK